MDTENERERQIEEKRDRQQKLAAKSFEMGTAKKLQR